MGNFELVLIFSPLAFWVFYGLFILVRSNYRAESNLCHFCACALSEGNKNKIEQLGSYGDIQIRFTCNNCIDGKFKLNKWLWPVLAWGVISFIIFRLCIHDCIFI